MKILGVDCGDVIFKAISGKPISKSMETLRTIVQSGHFEKVYIISKADYLGEILFRTRLRNLDFWDYTGIPKEHLFFCRRYEDKKGICETLSVTHFIDDRFRVLNNLRNVPYLFAFNPKRWKELRTYPEAQQRAVTITSWEEALPLLLRS